MNRRLKHALGIVALLVALASLLVLESPRLDVKQFGVTYVGFYAERFGLDSREVYTALFDDLGIKHVRLPAYWNEIEPKKDSFDFSELDWQLEEANKRGGKVIVAVGMKLPRWPECHIPKWATLLDGKDKQERLFAYIKAVLRRYDGHPAVSMWQVENEPFLSFGECPKEARFYLDGEIALVRSLTKKPIIITDSGELSIWIPAARRGDVFGTTMYRTIYNDHIGHFTYPLPPSFFRAKRTLTRLIAGDKPMVVIELQGESWQKEMTYEVSVEEQYKSMNPEKFRDTIAYAKKSGFDTFYLWGVEWWYWLKENGHPEMWEIAKEEIHTASAELNK
ncbi:MAG: hypothetical protein A3C80_02780 [Candidatus Ryanbacteria bacterium RIFCSPHIGHO2_02_FULL_45_43]|uniref:Glycoside hydrolase family 5 domain-containing protein n=1 Tax=Candidatus Ryanbacteria bacterium RIFCSPHIGHO2_01_45_13 TaxID=1802112 RepID=A0A1G2G0K5_9BACT|nr:MAG: hypothetical protein A2718_01195 [Candidatus Ryanbacteria bacterium RIFCSPHIGHO2_01_FULL_44_130]OGZ43522.1 MAG: hypothetical protein A2W41_04270 [Candidatus Ryanbacteria bacterium RIFCSPHIGHO2_01_45_13]OGZ47866.1 MAG: hypothetical protein A3C80_02780 [Candidatus Ryanbacteria bacterium RIFCSPHIGHO2_02_FULL_45_43]OGZ49911.1 MAG: hypothetical protein A3E55_03815 [Candidatus Ryanbacteria bacterium RIFCSPHIGHO2_12_FULL_44_20]OGZ51021.1 MAG: hypothetical protein A3A17_03355 [Candidatus Ryanba